MTTNEFVKNLDKLGFEVEFETFIDLETINIWVSKDDEPIMFIASNEQFMIDTNLPGFKELDFDIKRCLFMITTAYTLTPVNERGEN